MNRREFLASAAGFGLFANLGIVSAAHAASVAGARLRLGVLSDIHLRNPGDEKTFLKALAYFRDHGADGVLIAGDFADTGRISQAKLLADAWYRTFPNDKAPDGRTVEKLFIYGNHCTTAWTWGGNLRNNPARAAQEAIGYKDNRARIWQELFHEEWQPIWMKTVKGVPIIGAHWEERGNGIAIEQFMKDHAKEIDPKLPFVYTQHAHPKNTCFGSWAWGHDDGRATRALQPFRNAVAFSGHSHYTLTDERTIWQGAFTSINTASLKYASVDYALNENINGNGSGYRGDKRPHRMSQPNTGDGRQGMLVSFFDDHLAIERREFVTDQTLGDDWVVPMMAGRENFSYAARRQKRTAPEFPSGGEVKVKIEPVGGKKPFTAIRLDFPAAQITNRCRPFAYEATATLVEDDIDLVQLQKRMMSPDYYKPETKLARNVQFTFAAEDLPLKGTYVFSVRPVECMGNKGREIRSAPIRIG